MKTKQSICSSTIEGTKTKRSICSSTIEGTKTKWSVCSPTIEGTKTKRSICSSTIEGTKTKGSIRSSTIEGTKTKRSIRSSTIDDLTLLHLSQVVSVTVWGAYAQLPISPPLRPLASCAAKPYIFLPKTSGLPNTDENCQPVRQKFQPWGEEHTLSIAFHI